jgi:hypothetical protein
MKKGLIYFSCFVAVVLIVGIYRSFNQEHIPEFLEINNRVKAITVSNDSLFIQFKNSYFKDVVISSEVTSINKERYVFNDWVPLKNSTVVIPLKRFVGYDGEKYIPRQIKMIKFEISNPDSVFIESHEPNLDGFYKTTYHSYDLWYLDTLNKYKMSISEGGIFFVKK